MKIVLVEGRTFRMGDDWDVTESNDSLHPEKPVHDVTLTYNFYIGKYEVSFEEYDEYCEDTRKSKLDDRGWGRGKHPVINVSWYDAIKYCNYLSKKDNLPIAYSQQGNLLDKYGNETTEITAVEGYRLPTEAEWEYAARGGKYIKGYVNKLPTEAEWEYAARGGKYIKGYKYAGSNNPDEVAWYDGNSGGHTHEVGTKKPNELGIYDMSGNLWEWCQDWYDNYYYETSPDTNPCNHEISSIRSIRGGSWFNDVFYVRISMRLGNDPRDSSSCFGFRICRTAY